MQHFSRGDGRQSAEVGQHAWVGSGQVVVRNTHRQWIFTRSKVAQQDQEVIEIHDTTGIDIRGTARTRAPVRQHHHQVIKAHLGVTIDIGRTWLGTRDEAGRAVHGRNQVIRLNGGVEFHTHVGNATRAKMAIAHDGGHAKLSYGTVCRWITGAAPVIAATLVDPDVVGVRCAAVVPGLVGHHHQIPVASVVVQNGIREETRQIRAQGVAIIRVADDAQPGNAAAESASTEKVRQVARHLGHVGQPIFTEREQLVPSAARTPWVSVLPQPQVRHGKPSTRVSIEDFTHRQHQQFNVRGRRAGITAKQAKKFLIGINGQFHFQARRPHHGRCHLRGSPRSFAADVSVGWHIKRRAKVAELRQMRFREIGRIKKTRHPFWGCGNPTGARGRHFKALHRKVGAKAQHHPRAKVTIHGPNEVPSVRSGKWHLDA